MVTTIGRSLESLATSLRGLGETLGAFLGDFSDESLWRLFKVLGGCRHMLRGSWPTPEKILGRVPWGASGKSDKVVWESFEILGGAFLVDFLGECLGKSVKDPGTSRQVFGGILAAIPGSSRATDLGIRGQLMQSVWGDTGKIPGEPWGKCWLRSASGILATSWVQSRVLASGNPWEGRAKCFVDLGTCLGGSSGRLEKSLGVRDKSLGDSSGNVTIFVGGSWPNPDGKSLGIALESPWEVSAKSFET